MCDQMEHSNGYAAHSQAGHHVAQLRNCRVGQNALDIVLRYGNQRRKHRCRSAHPGHHRQRGGRSTGQRPGLHEWINPRNQINSSGHHGRCVNQRRNRRRALHRIRQPDMQRKLAALARRSRKNQEANCAGRRQSQRRRLRQQSSQRPRFQRAGPAVIKQQRAGLCEQPDDSEQKENVAHACGEKSLLRGRRGRRLLIPKADQ